MSEDESCNLPTYCDCSLCKYWDESSYYARADDPVWLNKPVPEDSPENTQ